jgi:hypothetical protein
MEDLLRFYLIAIADPQLANRPSLPLSDDRNRQGSENGSIRDYRPTPTSTLRRGSDDSPT